MHCPQCGQPFSDEVSFCKSCGLSLEGTKELFAPSGNSTLAKDWIKKRRRSRGRRGVFRGMIVIAIGIGLLAYMGSGNSVFPLAVIVVGLLRIFFAMTLQEVISKKAERTLDDDPRFASREAAAGLPPAHSIPVSDYYPAQVNTAQMAPPPSVTENTTNLLNDPES